MCIRDRFSAGLHDLAQRMPMELVRLYVTEGVRTPRVRIDYYDRIDELRALRREALLAEICLLYTSRCV